MTVPLSLTGKYQLVVLGQEGHSEVAAYASLLVNAVSQAFERLGVNPRKFLVPSVPASSLPVLDRHMLTVAVYFGCAASPTLSVDETAMLNQLLGVLAAVKIRA
jgi:TRAP-type uncharacterized transport system substrate-binding protein